MEPEQASLNPGVKVEVVEHAEDSGGTLLYERMEAEFDVGGFDQSPDSFCFFPISAIHTL